MKNLIYSFERSIIPLAVCLYSYHFNEFLSTFLILNVRWIKKEENPRKYKEKRLYPCTYVVRNFIAIRHLIEPAKNLYSTSPKRSLLLRPVIGRSLHRADKKDEWGGILAGLQDIFRYITINCPG